MEKMIVGIYVCCVGCCIGSFANVVIYRLPLGLNFVKGRSYCPQCHHHLSVFDLIPLFSFVALKGKCRYCHAPISFQYFVIEGISGGMAVLCFLCFEKYSEGILVFMICELLLIISVIDLHTMMIYDCFHCFILLLACFHSFMYPQISFIARLLGMLVVSFPMVILNCVVKESFGLGDVKLMCVAGFLLGIKKCLLAGMLAVFSGGIAAFALLTLKRKNRKSHMPFAPFLSLGIGVSLIFGEQLIRLYTCWLYSPCSF